MELKNNITCLLSVFLILEIQKCITCFQVTHGPFLCDCSPSPLLTDHTSQNLFSTNPINNPLLLDSETDPFTTGQKNFGVTMPPPFANIEEIDSESIKAYGCTLMPCFNDDTTTAVCACNYNTGNVVTFTNNCDVEKHNCRFNTKFKVILNEICPWEFQSRRNDKSFEIDYSNPKYYN